MSERRIKTFSVVSVVLGLGLGLAAFGLISLVVGWFEGGERLSHRVHDLGWGALGGVILSGGLLLQAKAPLAKISVTQGVLAGLVATLAGYVLAGEVQIFLLVMVLLIALLVWLHPTRKALAGRGAIAWSLGALAVLAAVPLSRYALDQAAIQEQGGFGAHWSEFHWASMASLALAIPLVALVAALRAPGWRITAWQAGLAALVLGTASLVFPGYVSSLGAGTAWGLVAGAVVFVALAEWEARRAT